MPTNMLPYNDKHIVTGTKTTIKRPYSNDKGKTISY